uniref:Nerve growth factor a (beta polypeptide) n=1 Tax=Takifugu rubripes TaxID=31033 RepID=H2TTY9_TAKRU
MRSSPLVLLLLIGVQAVLNMGGGLAWGTGAANHTVDPKLFSKRRYRSSPRVVFSEEPPTHDALEYEGYDVEGARGARVRRKAGSRTMHRGEYSVCESINTWVGNLTQATDISENEVMVLPNVTINNVVKKQFFYETTCRSPTHRGGRSGCLGIDSRHWNSYCTNTHIYVSALTLYQKRTAWRYIRINAACVCVLSRKSWAGRSGH